MSYRNRAPPTNAVDRGVSGSEEVTAFDAALALPPLARVTSIDRQRTRTAPASSISADSMLGMANIRVLEVASFYFMFQMKPAGSVAHFQICGTTSCMICGAEDLMAVTSAGEIVRAETAPEGVASVVSPDERFTVSMDLIIEEKKAEG